MPGYPNGYTEEQDLESAMHEFQDWFEGSDEVKGDYTRACEILKDKIFKVINMNVLFKAYWYMEQQETKEEKEPPHEQDDSLPY